MSEVTRIGQYRVAGPGIDYRFSWESVALGAAVDYANHADGPNLWYVLENDEPIWRVVRRFDGIVRKFDIREET